MNDPIPPSRTGRMLFALALVSGGALLWPMFSQPHPLALDEHGSMWMLQANSLGALIHRCLSYGAVPPVSTLLERLSLAVWGMHEWSLRLPTAMAYLAAIGVMFLWLRRFFGELTAGGAALLLAWHPEVVDEVRIARAYGLVLCLAVLLLWATWEWGRRPGSWRWALVWSLLAVALAWTHYTAGLLIAMSYPTAVLLGSRVRPRERNRWLTWMGSAALVAILCLPLLPSMFRLRLWGPYLIYFHVQVPWWQSVSTLWWLGFPAGLVMACGPGVGRDASSYSRMQQLGLLLCSLIPVLLLFLLARGDATSLSNPRYRIALAPAGAAFIALLLTRESPPWRTVTALAVTIAVSWSLAAHPPWQLVRLADPSSLDWKLLTEHLRDHSQPNELIFVQSGLVESLLVSEYFEDEQFMEYVACRVSRFYLPADNPRIGLATLWGTSREMRDWYQERFDVQRENTGQLVIWAASATDTDLNRESLDGILRIAAEAGYVVTETHTWPTATLVRMEPAAASP